MVESFAHIVCGFDVFLSFFWDTGRSEGGRKGSLTPRLLAVRFRKPNKAKLEYVSVSCYPAAVYGIYVVACCRTRN